MGPPPEGALNLAAWQMIRDLVAANPALNDAAWQAMRGITGLMSQNRDGGDVSLGRASGGGYVEF
jgi:hypothetical protein